MIVNYILTCYYVVVFIGFSVWKAIELYPRFTVCVICILVTMGLLFWFRKQLFWFCERGVSFYCELNQCLAEKLCEFLFKCRHPASLLIFLLIFIITVVTIKNSNVFCRILFAPLFGKFFSAAYNQVIIRAKITRGLPVKPVWVSACSFVQVFEEFINIGLTFWFKAVLGAIWAGYSGFYVGRFAASFYVQWGPAVTLAVVAAQYFF